MALILDHDGKHVYTFVRPKRRSKENAMAKEADFALGKRWGKRCSRRKLDLWTPGLRPYTDRSWFAQCSWRRGTTGTEWGFSSRSGIELDEVLHLNYSSVYLDSSSDIDMSPGTGFVTRPCDLLEAEAWHQEQSEQKRGPLDQLGCSCNWWYSRGAWWMLDTLRRRKRLHLRPVFGSKLYRL